MEEEQTFRLDTALYIGIGVDVFLAIIACVLIHKWRQRKRERTREVDGMYGVSQRTEMDTILMDSRSVSRVVALDSARRSVHTSDQTRPAYMAQTSERGSSRHYDTESEGIRNSYTNYALDHAPEDPDYPTREDDRVVQNPLAGRLSSNNPAPESHHGEDMSLSTYYTYKPPVKQLDGESSEIMSQGEKSPVSSPPPAEYIDLDEGSRSPASLPSPLPISEGNEYSYPDDHSTANDRASIKSGSTLNFGEESVAKLYTTNWDQATPIM